MSPILLLTGLLALAFFGSMLVGGRTIRGFGLPSGTEFLLIGILVGPRFIGVFTRQSLVAIDVITIVLLSWLALDLGSHYGYVGGRKVSMRRMFAGFGLATIAAVMTGVPAVAFAFVLTDLSVRELLVLGLGVGAVSAETTRHALRWVIQRYRAEGVVTQLLSDVCEADDALPLLLLAVIAVIAPHSTAIALPGMPWSGLGATFAIGGALGATAAALFDIEPRTSQRWGILLGTGLLCTGVSLRLGLSAVTACFFMGVVATRLAKERSALQALLGTTERAVMFPALVLAGASVVFPPAMPFLPIAAAVIVMRILAKLLTGRLLARSIDEKALQGGGLGFGLLPAGVLSISVGLAFMLRFPGRISEWVLALAAVHAVVGEILGTAMLRRALRTAGEIAEASVSATPRPVPAPVQTPAQIRAAQRLLRTTAGRARLGGNANLSVRSRRPGGTK